MNLGSFRPLNQNVVSWYLVYNLAFYPGHTVLSGWKYHYEIIMVVLKLLIDHFIIQNILIDKSA